MRFAVLSCVLLVGCAQKVIEIDHAAPGDGGGEDGLAETSADTALPDSSSMPDGDALSDAAIDACVPNEVIPVAMPATTLYLMVDKSQSMGPLKTSPKWAGVRSALDAFLKSTADDGLRLAISFFPRAIDDTPTCGWKPYSIPEAGFASRLTVLEPLMTAFDAEAPDGITRPMYPALLGAVNGVVGAVPNFSLETGAVVFVTDGDPDGPAPMCDMDDPTSHSVLEKIAATGVAGAPSIRTFVIGLPGVNVALANQIAAAGGTDAALLVTAPANVADQTAAALAKVRRRAAGCEFKPPLISMDTPNVKVALHDGATDRVLSRDDDCTTDGYSFNADGTIRLCPPACSALREASAPTVELRVGCP